MCMRWCLLLRAGVTFKETDLEAIQPPTITACMHIYIFTYNFEFLLITSHCAETLRITKINLRATAH